MYFASDNTAPAHPNVMEALMRANEGFDPSYACEDAMDDVRNKLREIFEAPDAAVFLVPTGTAANVLSLACYTQPWQTIFCHEFSHINIDECGAPEFYTGGAKLTTIGGDNGIFQAETLRKAINGVGQGDVHSVQRGTVSITNVSECGTLYDVEAVKAISKVCKEFKLPLHMDGARFANALVALGCTPAELTWKSGVDVLSFGGTKNGLVGAEAVIIFDPDKAWEFELRRKRGGHLFSKHRYLAAQMQAYLADDLWLELASHANQMAYKLSDGLVKAGAECLYPTEASGVFASLPRRTLKKLTQAGAEYSLWPYDQSMEGPGDGLVSVRFMCSWATREEHISDFLRLI